MSKQRMAKVAFSLSSDAQRLLLASNDALHQGNLDRAIALRSRAVQLHPKSGSLHASLGLALWGAQEIAAAEKEFQTALRLDPKEPTALYGMGEIRYSEADFQEAERLLSQVVKSNPDNIRAHLLLVDCLTELGRTKEADAESVKAIQANPRSAVPISSYGLRLQRYGKFEDALEYFSRALQLDPADGLAYLGLAQQKKFKEADREIVDSMRIQLSRPDLDPGARINILFARGKALDDLGEYGAAMDCFVEANQMEDESMSRNREFPSAAYVREFQTLRDLFSEGFIESGLNSSPTEPQPIFIVGMMRSGTTLVEQILSAHPEVAAGGEIDYWKAEIFRVIDFDEPALDVRRLLPARKKYSQILRTISNQTSFVTDKLPDNYRVIGPLRMLFPQAKFIHCSRHPVDTCLSIYMTPFQKPLDFSSDPQKLIFIYREYEKLMGHWKSVIPSKNLVTIRYEALVENREAMTRQLLEFCDLEWTDSCLRFHQNDRPVATASVWQVRQPVYRTSIDRWRNYEPWLGEFRNLLSNSG